MTRVINFLGGPGTGKSTAATGLFSFLKSKNINCEYVSEYAKEITWEGTHALLENQLHIFSEQFRRQWRLLGKVDYIITDSPLVLSPIYLQWNQEKTPKFTKQYIETTKQYMLETFQLFDNHNVFIIRDKPYQTVGRNQTEDEAKELDARVKGYLLANNIDYETVYSNFDVRIFADFHKLIR